MRREKKKDEDKNDENRKVLSLCLGSDKSPVKFSMPH
jgi:hypothetical protein